MPHIVEFRATAFPHYRPIRVDLDYLKIGYVNSRARSDGFRDAIEMAHLEVPESVEKLPIPEYRLNVMAHRIFQGAIASSMLAIVESGGPKGAPDVPLSNILKNGMVPLKYVFADPIAALQTVRDFGANLKVSPTPESVEMVILAENVNRIINIMSSSGLYESPIPANAVFEYAKDKTGREDFIFIPGNYDEYAGEDENTPAFVSRRQALLTSAKKNPSGLDALKGPVFAYGSRRDDFQIDIDDIESMVSSDYLNDRDIVEDTRTDGLGWEEMWDDRATCRAEGILDSVETETLKERLRPTLDRIIENIGNVTDDDSSDEDVEQAITHQFAENRKIIQDILDQWNSEQTAHDFSQNDREIVTFTPGLTRQGIIDALTTSAHAGLEAIATLRQATGGSAAVPWETLATQNLERAHAVMMAPPPSQPKPVALPPLSEPSQTQAPAPTTLS